MFVPVCIDLIHFDKYGHLFIYLKFLDMCQKYKWPIIASEHFIEWRKDPNAPSLESLQKSAHKDTFDFRILPKCEEDLVEKIVVPNKIIQSLLKQSNSMLDVSLFLQNERCKEIEDVIDAFILELEKKGQKIEGFITLESTIKSIDYLAQIHNIPLIRVAKGPLRRMDYINTGYWGMQDIFGSGECEERFRKFLKENSSPGFKWLDNRELLAIFLSEKRIGFLKAFGITPIYEMLVAGTYSLMPTLFSKSTYTDIEVLSEMKELYGDDVVFRPNPADPYSSRYRKYVKKYDEGGTGILSLLRTKRIASAGSNIMFDAMLWGRTVYCKPNLFPVSFKCQRNYSNRSLVDADIEFLNFFCFAFLVPFDLIWDPEYIRWRLTMPQEQEIFQKHLEYWFQLKGLDLELLQLPGEERLKALLCEQGYDSTISENHVPENVDKRLPLVFIKDRNERIQYTAFKECLPNNTFQARFKLSDSGEKRNLFFVMEGYFSQRIKIISAMLDERAISIIPDGVFKETDGYVTFNRFPSYLINSSLSDGTSITITWIEGEKQDANVIIRNELPADIDARLYELESIKNSTCWKMTYPIRKVLDWIKRILQRKVK